ncbi:phage protein NinX family protein [Citrobacter meridianamericanus]|uniref:phage protein NinX family protein n=1 Tax=Citrobacter meridianamericanus TaxID=2894201 RepID=UPI00351D03F6
MDYSKLSDFEVNLKLAHILLGKDNYDWNSDKKEVYLAGIDGGEFLPNGYFDPCNNPADAWPIIFKYKISIEFDGDNSTEPQTTWCHARNLYRSCGINYQSNPLRAAMIVFLMMQDSANVQDNTEG